ncbi:MAG: MotA/TolQ/ExbB proton channel family protein, partial [Alphaproteobacteria bacterium]|nr:MotA/TolQ/ExbB proton channel family protein [Alphaproteobacteria bacterium]
MLKRTAAVLAAALAICLSMGEVQAQRTAPVSHDTQGQELPPPDAAPTTDVAVDQSGDTFAPALNRISFVSLFLHADLIVKAVFVLLVLASLWSWAIIINKWMALGLLKRRAGKFEKVFWSGLSLDELYQQFSQRTDHPFAAVFTAALREWRRAFEGGPPRESLVPGVKDRIEKAMNVTILRETEGIERQLGFLATVGATAPFVGLF